MYLKSLTYEEHIGKAQTWKLKKISFGQITLIVGKNSSGKSRAINIIAGIAGVLSSRAGGFHSGTWNCTFARMKGKAEEIQEYNLGFENSAITEESFRIKKKLIMHRDDSGSGFILKKNSDTKVQYKVDQNQPMLVARSDPYQHPQFEHIKKWARDACVYRFGTDLGKGNLTTEFQAPPDSSSILQVSQLVEHSANVFANTDRRFSQSFRSSVIDDMCAIGYEIDDIKLASVQGLVVNGVSPMAVSAKERRVNCYVSQGDMSQGMYRALAIIIQFNANIFWTQSTMVGREPSLGDSPMIVIDDIGEGLDHERSRKLIQLLVDKSLAHNIQLIMSSNDRYVMNSVPLEFWTVLNRKGSIVYPIDNRNSHDAFEEFEYSGLSNFDFFSGEHYIKDDE